MITDVIDDSEVKNGIREDGTIYAVYSFARKLGQAFSSGMIGSLLSLVGYTSATALTICTEGIFTIPVLYDYRSDSSGSGSVFPVSSEQETCRGKRS